MNSEIIEQTLLSERLISEYLQNLREAKDQGNSDAEAKLLVDWVNLSIDEISSRYKTESVNNLKVFLQEFLVDYKDLLDNVRELDYSTAQHSVEIMIFTLNYFESLPGISPRQKLVGAIASLLHDVGKSTVPSEIILKRGSLTPDEKAIMRKHPNEAVAILAKIDFTSLGFSDEEIKTISDAATQHHERENGSGYPNGLKSAKISEIGKIMAVVDMFAAKTSRMRNYYREPLSEAEAIEDLRCEANNGLLDGELVEKFVISLNFKSTEFTG